MTARFNVQHLSVLAYAQGFTLWHYKAGPTKLCELESVGYFDPASDLLSPGDMIMLSCVDGGRLNFVVGENDQISLARLS